MIITDMRNYNYFIYGDVDKYGQTQIADEPTGTVKMAINIMSQSVQDNIKYRDCSYIGLTHDKGIDDTYVIEYGNEKLKVLYVNPKGRYKQIYMSEML